jgi:hypothetical protein
VQQGQTERLAPEFEALGGGAFTAAPSVAFEATTAEAAAASEAAAAAAASKAAAAAHEVAAKAARTSLKELGLLKDSTALPVFGVRGAGPRPPRNGAGEVFRASPWFAALPSWRPSTPTRASTQ